MKKTSKTTAKKATTKKKATPKPSKKYLAVNALADKLVAKAGTKTVTKTVNKLNRAKALKQASNMIDGQKYVSPTLDGLPKKKAKAKAKPKAKSKAKAKR